MLILASGSPRRADLLRSIGLEFRVIVPDVDETVGSGEAPLDYVRRLAVEKAAAVGAAVNAAAGAVDPAGVDPDTVLAADTCVELDGAIFGKPADGDDARRMLRALSGRVHHVHTGVAARRAGTTRVETCTTLVTFGELSEARIDAYVVTCEPLDKAGAYALQGAAGAFVPEVHGSVSNVIGLPLHLVAELLDLG
jgi:septum formation protein